MKKTYDFTAEMVTDYYNEPYCGLAEPVGDDAIINLLTYYKAYPDWLKNNGYDKMKFSEYADAYDQFRLKYDADSRYYNSLLDDPVAALRGDTITSFFTPYKMMLKQTTGKMYHKCNNPFDELIVSKNDHGFKEANDAFATFIELYHTPGNFMLLPHRGMNSDRYRCSQDRIDKSLYECFPGGKLAKFFGINASSQLEYLTEWVKSQNLEFMFEDECIERDRIIPMNKNNPYVAYEKMTKDELIEFIDASVKIIKKRNSR